MSVAPSKRSWPEKKESLWRITVSPAIWAAHFLASYITAAIYCAKYSGGRDGSLWSVRVAIFVFTVLAFIGMGLNARAGWVRYRSGTHPPPFDSDTPEDRHRFLGFSTLLLAGVSLLATLFSALVILFFQDCR